MNQHDFSSTSACLREAYAVEVDSITPMSGGLDSGAETFRVRAQAGDFFLKVRREPVNEAPLRTPALIAASGVQAVVAPLPTIRGELWATCGDRFLILFPFVEGELLANSSLDQGGWRRLGDTLRHIHSFEAPEELARWIRIERFDLPSARALRHLEALKPLDSKGAEYLHLLLTNRRRIDALIEEAEALQRSCAHLPHVICHSDLHPWNIIVDAAGDAQIIDWEDGPLFAPRERDFIFLATAGGEELLAGCGETRLSAAALRYFWLEREIEDIASTIATVFYSEGVPPNLVEEYIALQERYFASSRALEY